MRRARLWIISSLIFLVGASFAQPVPEAIAQAALAGADRNFRACSDPPAPGLGCRTLFDMMLAYLETGQHLERLPRLLELAAQMQDRNPQNASYGNFRWYWRDERVGDWNAVDFCMQIAALIWLRHKERLAPDIRARLQELTDLGLEGLLRHAVPVDYTNIVFMNAGDLILLGELMGRREIVEEGRARFEEALGYTSRNGTHEYASPTYYGVDLNDLGLLWRYSRDERIRRQAKALLRFFWTDIAANWHPAIQRLCGSQSRTYDYVAGLGYLDMPLMAAGWLPAPTGHAPDLLSYLARWEPPGELAALSQKLPRLVQQRWGPGPAESRVHFLTPDVTLGTSGSAYVDLTDMPLTIDFPGERGQPRGYFIADGRNDPYGKQPFASGIHSKALHLQIFWAGAQRAYDAVGLVVYTAGSLLQPGLTRLESNLVLPREGALWLVGDKSITFTGQEPQSVPFAYGEPIIMRRGTAAVGIKILGTRNVAGEPAPAVLLDEAGKIPCVRLIVRHQIEGQPLSVGKAPMAAFWIRVGTGLRNAAAFERWRKRFVADNGQAKLSPTEAEIVVTGVEGPVRIHAQAPWGTRTAFTPRPPEGILLVNGQDLGAKILRPVKPESTSWQALPVISVERKAGVFWEAESGLVRPLMAIGEDAAASGGKYVWTPGEPGQIGPAGRGSVAWRLRIAQKGRYWFWGRVLAPTPADDSFFVAMFDERGRERVSPFDWHTGVHPTWEWTRVTRGSAQEAQPLELPAGEIILQLRVREDGTKIDRLFLTPDEKAIPTP